MENTLDNQEIEIPCENCGRRTKKTVKWIKTNSAFTCGCGTRITLEAGQFKSEIAKVELALADLKRTLGRLGR